MANRQNSFLLKRSNVSGKVPLPGDLKLGEIALNTADVILYTSGTTENSILPIGWDRVSRTGDTVTGNFIVNGSLTTNTVSATTYYNLQNYGLFAQTQSSTPISGTNLETSLISSGVGTLTVPANSFKVGDSFSAFLMGHLSCVGTATLHIRIKTLGGVLLADTGVIAMSLTTAKHWKLDIKFTIRSLGAPTVASIASGGLFAYTKNSGFNFEGVNFSIVNNLDFDTTVDNTLVVTAQWNTSNSSNSIFSEIFLLNKIY